MSPSWRWSCGKKGVNRVTVYERLDATSLFLEWFDNAGRHRQSLRVMVGEAITDHGVGMEYAKHFSDEQERQRNALALGILGIASGTHTVSELLKALHDTREATWSTSYRRDQKRFRLFWTAALGRHTRLHQVTPALVESLARKAAQNWSPRTMSSYLRYIVDAFTFARRKLKWIDERHDLQGVTFPRTRGKSLAYTDDEVRRLLPALFQVDTRAGGVGEVAYATGRRLTAIRTLPASAYVRVGVVPILRFPVDTDKSNRSGEAVLTRQAARALDALALTPASRATGFLFPGGELAQADSLRPPIRAELLIKMLKDAERRAGIEHVKGRAWHGIKRGFATLTGDERRAAAAQSGTNESTLRDIYEQDTLEPKVELAKMLEARRG